MKTNLQEAIEEILDLVSAREPEYVGSGNEIRWGHDTNCGEADDIQDKAIKILRKHWVIGK